MSGPVVPPTREDPLVRSLSERTGGPLGVHAYGRRRWFTAAGVLLLLTALTFAVGMVQKVPCYSTGWSSGTDEVDDRYVAMCYSDLPPLYVARGFAEAAWPYSDDPEIRQRYPSVMEYPVGISYWAWGTAKVTHWLAGTTADDLAVRAELPVAEVGSAPGVARETRIFVIVNVLGFAAAALLAAWLLAGVNRRRPWDAAAYALAPTLALSALINWDLLAVVLVAAALWAWGRDRPVLTGVMIGLGTAVKLYPLLLLGGVLVLCLRRRRWRDLGLASVAAALAWVAAQVPAWATGWSAWTVFWTFNAERASDLGSIWLVVSQSADVAISDRTINAVTLGFFAAWCLGVLVLGLRAPEPPTLAQLGFLVVVGFLLVNKVYSPQYVLWLLPLAVLARPRWRDQLVWQGTEVLYFCCVWWYLAGQLDSGGEAPFYWLAIILRMAGELYLAGMVVRDVLWPARRPEEESAPAAGSVGPDPRDDGGRAEEDSAPTQPPVDAETPPGRP